MNSDRMYINDIWIKVKNHIKNTSYFENNIYDAYIEDANLLNIDEKNKKAVVVVDTFISKTILGDDINILNSSFQTVLNDENINCEIITKKEAENFRVSFTPQPVKQEFMVVQDDGIMPNQTFDNFVVGPSNKESHAAALGCAYRPGQFYTPLFIYGNSGLGKTHLLHSIGNFAKKSAPESKVLYTSSSQFVRYVANSIKDGTIEDFKDQMNSLDVLLIDDIQFIAGKEKSHEIFFHIFNELVNNRKQIVITSDRLPTEIKGLEERLISRFSSGLSVSVTSPEFETALKILKMKINNQSIDNTIFDDDTLSYLATNFSKDVRQLEGALNRLLFFSIEFSDESRITLDIAMNAFKGERTPIKEVDPREIKRIVSDYYGLTTSQLIGKSRTKAIANARHIAIYLIRKHLDLPYNRIGEEFGKRDHSTIISACDKIEKGLKKDPILMTAITDLEKKFIKL